MGKTKKIILLSGLTLVSFGIGYLIKTISDDKKDVVDGILRVDNSDPDNTNGLFLELQVPVEYIINKKTVKFKILKENYIRK